MIPNYTDYFSRECKFTGTCKACKLAHSDQTKNPPIPSGFIPSDEHKLRLIVISDHPGFYEVKHKYPMYSNQPEINAKPHKHIRPNAGNYIRALLEGWGLDVYSEVYFTNVLKCEPGANTVRPIHILTCKKTWLDKELILWENLNHKCPILALGKYAYQLIQILIPELRDTSLNSIRRTVLYYKAHPVICSINPAAAAKSVAAIETFNPDEVKSISHSLILPIWKGSPRSIYETDLSYIKEFI